MGKIINLQNEDDYIICEGCESRIHIDNAMMEQTEGDWFCITCVDDMQTPCNCNQPEIHMEGEWTYCEKCGKHLR